MTQAIAANARLSLLTGAYYLQARLDPATPPQVASRIHTLANILLELAENALAGSTNDQPLERKGEAEVTELVELCK
jgi:hypothetical protein